MKPKLTKRIWFLIILCVLTLPALAQNEINTEFINRMSYVFSPLEKNRVPNGLLLDYAMEFADVKNYNGVLTDSNKVNAGLLKDMYTTIAMSAIHGNAGGLYGPDYMDSIWQLQRQPGSITLSGLYYNYSGLRGDAVNAGLITVSNDQLYDRYVNGVWQNPYQTETVFAMSPPLHAYSGKSFQVMLPSNLWFTNNASSVSTIAVDFNDGTGYRIITMGQAINISYADTGRKTWTFRLTLTNNINLYSHTEMQIELEPNKYGSAGVVSVHGFARPGGPIFLSADNAYNGETGKGWITVDYANANLRLRRPLIVVEGFDPGYLLAPERQFGFANFATFIEELNRSNDLRNLLQSTNQQYDIIYVDWFRGTDFLQRNALLLERVIRWVNEQKAIDGSVEPNVVLGQSMGGVISRWALRDMENRGLNHQTRLFISWDAPQQGANIPVAYQHLVHHANSLFVQSAIPFLLGGNNTIKIVKNALNLTDVPAARQMLMNRALANGQIDNSDHNAWQLELRNLGYPLQSRNIAVSNGSECGIGQGFQPYADLINVNGRANTRFLSELALGSAAGFDAWLYTSLLTLKPQFLLGIVTGRNDFFFELNCKAQPENSTYQIYKGKITFRKKILWLVNVNTIITDRSRNADASVLPIDGTPGGMFDTEINLQNTSFQNWAIKYNISASSIPNFNFIPTTSALDIGGGNTTLTLVNYKAGYVGATPPAAPFNTPFANFTTAFNKVFVSNGSVNNNEHHIQIFLRNGNWVAEELNGNVNARTNCSAFCGNTAITGSDAVCSSGSVFSIPFVAGSTYSWFVDNPNLATVSSNGNTATITQNGTFTGPLQIMVTASGVCGTNTITRNNVWVGAPTIQGWYNSPTNSSEPLKPFIRFQTNYNDACYLQYITTNMQVSPGATVLWETPSLSSASIPWSQTGNNLRFYFTDVNQWGIFPITATNACGTTNLRYRFQSSNGCAGTLSLRNIQSGTAMDESPGKFAVFPNPAKNLLYVTIPADSIDMAHTQIHLMDFSGKTLQSIKKVNNLNSFNMSGFASGMYLIEITDKNKRIIKKIIKY